jgi:flavin-dependent dehydrogenase
LSIRREKIKIDKIIRSIGIIAFRMEKHEVVIVGAGLAGLQAAKILAENGRDVLILEKVPQYRIGDKICAGALSAKAVKVINPPTSIYDINGDSYDLIMHLPNKDIEVKNEGRFQTPMISKNKLVQWQLREVKKAGAGVIGGSEVIKVSKEKKELTIKRGTFLGMIA